MIIGLQTNENANEISPGKLMKMVRSFYDNRPENVNEICPGKLMKMVRSFYDNMPTH